tara:strand:- start:1188 stop:1586 length:399 start_codon:yes stop_codon:yes gene_type:complete
MNNSLKFEKVTYSKFRNYLLIQNDSLKWFLWHLNKTSKEFTYQYIYNYNEIVGVISLMKHTSTYVGIYIDKSFRGNNIGTDTIKLIKNSNPNENLIFKVSKLNNISLLFFDRLISKHIIKNKKEEINFYFYK